MLQAILLVILIFVCVALVGVILLQRSEGGALGMGGGPSGFMSTRGVGDLLTRTTTILAGVFFVLCLGLTLIIGRAHKGDAVVDRLNIQGVDPAALARQRALQRQPATSTGAPAPATVGAPLFEAPKPEVHGAAPQFLTPPTAVPAPVRKSVAAPSAASAAKPSPAPATTTAPPTVAPAPAPSTAVPLAATTAAPPSATAGNIAAPK